jgi:hypothetical protein
MARMKGTPRDGIARAGSAGRGRKRQVAIRSEQLTAGGTVTASQPALALELFDGLHAAARASEAGPAFARHETFAPRFGWFRKGFLRAAANATAFLHEDAHLKLGVGKNMGRSIRYWCHATGLLEDAPLAGQRAMGSRPSPFGKLLLGSDGWDEYMEDPVSLWVLHWKLVCSPALATAWYYAFTVFPEVEFTIEGLSTSLTAYTALHYPNARTAPSSFHKDAVCIARMYGETVGNEVISEETIQSPFADLGLLRSVADIDGKRFRRYRFEVGPKPGLTAEIVAAASLEFAASVAPGTQTIGLSRLIADPGSPGMAFKLGEAALTAYLEDASRLGLGVTLADAAGLVQLAFDGRPAEIATKLLHHHFTARRSEAAI